MKFLLLADTHGKNQIPIDELASGCDAVFILGDTMPEDLIGLDRVVVPKIGVHGNWDAVRPGKPDWYDEFGVVNAHLKVCEVGGIRIAGFDGNMKYVFAERFQSAGNPAWEEAKHELDQLRQLPPVDIFISHCAPATDGDHSLDTSHRGIQAIRDYIERTQPHHHLYGHRHENKVTNFGETLSRCVYPSMVIEF
ncbi:MAG: Ser/Thr protein phosphatase family protein [uncultured bacterium]|nr:MAG: Ser/Thr protein phosphatase family protein [uncultured bacterium]